MLDQTWICCLSLGVIFALILKENRKTLILNEPHSHGAPAGAPWLAFLHLGW